MSEHEFLVLDELYFVISFQELMDNLEIPESEVVSTLKVLHGKGWLRCYTPNGEQVDEEKTDLDRSFSNYHYLATKAGLKAHNYS
jgi:hypothetical protein